MFLDPARLMNQFAEAVGSCAKCDGFVIDLRGNPGGIGVMAMGMAGWFIDQPGSAAGNTLPTGDDFEVHRKPRAPLRLLDQSRSWWTAHRLRRQRSWLAE